MPDKWSSRWDQFCFLRANNPSKEGWIVLVLDILTALALAGAIYFGAELLSSLSALGG